MNLLNINKILIQTSVWVIIGLSFPVVAFLGYITFNLLNVTTYKDYFGFVLIVTFLSVAVFWWWWVLSKIIQFSTVLQESEKKFLELKKDIQHFKLDLSNKY